MLLISNILLVCLVVLDKINENAADTERTRKNKIDTEKNRVILKKLVEFLNDSERTNTDNDESIGSTGASIFDGIEIRNSKEMKAVMKHLQKNYDYEIMDQSTYTQPRVYIIRNPDVLEDFVEQQKKELEPFDPTLDTRRLGHDGYGKGISLYAKRFNVLKRSTFSYDDDNFKLNNPVTVKSLRNKKEKSYYLNQEKTVNRQKYDFREKNNENDKYDRDRSNSKDRYNNKKDFNEKRKINSERNQVKYYNRNKEVNSYHSNKDNFDTDRYDTEIKYDTRNKYKKQEKNKSSFQSNKIERSRSEYNKDIPENMFKQPYLTNSKTPSTFDKEKAEKPYNHAIKTTKHSFDDSELRKKIENDEKGWGNPNIRLPKKPNQWNDVGIEKTSNTRKDYNEWSQVGIDRGTSKREWNNDRNDHSPKDWAYFDTKQKITTKRYYNDEKFTIRTEKDDFTTRFPADNKKRYDYKYPKNDYNWDRPVNKYKNRIENSYSNEYKKKRPRGRSNIGYGFGKTPIPFVGKRHVYDDK